MNPNIKRFLFIFVIATVISFGMFYLLEDDKNCVFIWGSKCSNSYLFRAGFQSVFMSFLLFFLNKNKKVDKQ